MVHPFVTSSGRSYEYSAISRWLAVNDTDPMTNERLASKTLIPNHSLRSQIVAWFEENPSSAGLRNNDAAPPPPEAYQVGINELDKILVYRDKRGTRGKTPAKAAAGAKVETLPSTFTAYGHTYSFTRPEKRLRISCDGQVTIDMPERCVFAVPDGLIFYDPKETVDKFILPGTEVVNGCPFQGSCSRGNCKFAHPFACVEGVDCARQSKGCKFFHPPSDSVKPITPTCTACKYGTSCTRLDCWFAHPKGRMSVLRVKARLLVTHSHTLTELPTPVEMQIDFADSATCFQMQGEFVFSFQPHAGTWAKKHYKVVTVHRFDASLNKYQTVGDYSLDNHYCNCAVAAGRYIVFSFWPFENEAVRTIWGCLQVTRAIAKDLKSKTKECTELKTQLEASRQDSSAATQQASAARQEAFSSRQEASAARKEASAARQEAFSARQETSAARQDASVARQETSAARKEAFSARQETSAARQEARTHEQTWRQMQQRQEQQFQERMRLRDPIHIYALPDGASGMRREDWHLVLDYHKGAHDIELGEPRPDGNQQVNFIVDSTVLQFDLVVPKDINSLKMKLPLSPAVLCADF